MNDEDRKGDWIQTFTGLRAWVEDPRIDDVRIEDIAHALALINRFGGHSRIPYNVAQHSIMVSEIVPKEHALVGLLHDAPEAFCGDLVRPIKRALPAYRELEIRWAWAIGCKLGIDLALLNLPPEVKHADEVALSTERRDLMVEGPAWTKLGAEPLPDRIVPWSWQESERRFLDRFDELGGRR